MSTYMVHAPIDVRALKKWAGQRRLVRRGTLDDGLALHVLLSGMFGKGVLQPFRLYSSDRRRWGAIYAYSDDDEHSLQKMAAAVAPPESCSIVRPEGLRTKRMPQAFQVDQRLGFELRARPVRRVHEDIRDARWDKVVKKGAEVDAYWLENLRKPLADSSKVVLPRDGNAHDQREQCYWQWLSARLGKTADVKKCRLQSFRRVRVVRGRATVEGPDAILRGNLVVRNTEEFARTVRQGIGRHKAYGYGMLLLRPPGRPTQ